jgi:CRP/FNR family transcriptional regulator, cyclic AMP receptor protein
MKQVDHESRRRLLQSCPLFATLPVDILDDILLQATERFVRRGQMVFQKGDEGSYMVAVLSGRIRISATSSEGREITLNMIDAGEVFGEVALLDGKPRSADAAAIEDSKLIMVERRHFLPYLASNNDLALRVIDVLCERLRDTTETLGNLAMLDLPGRLARRLLILASEYGKSSNGRIHIDIRLSDTDLARFVGCTRETVNKQMRAWEDANIVDRAGGRIALRRPSALKRIAGQD